MQHRVLRVRQLEGCGSVVCDSILSAAVALAVHSRGGMGEEKVKYLFFCESRFTVEVG